MTSTWSLFVPGVPAPQGSKRHVGRGIMVESSKEVGPWRERIALAAHQQGCPLVGGAVELELDFVMPRPKSAPKSRTPDAVKRPDIDKLARAVLDALTGVVLADDSQVVRLTVVKRIAEIAEATGVQIELVDVVARREAYAAMAEELAAPLANP